MGRHHHSAIIIAQALGLVLVSACARSGISDGLDDEGGSSEDGVSPPQTTSASSEAGWGGIYQWEETSCVPAFYIPTWVEDDPEGGWPAPTSHPDTTGFDASCVEFVESFGGGDGDGGTFTCDCVVAQVPLTYTEPIDLSVELLDDSCCFTWTFEEYYGEEGRPFLVNGEVRRADVERRDDWCTQRFLIADSRLDDGQREDIANAWLDSARMEHASIAAFSRHLMQLMALGAPAELVRDTETALRDEIRHTRACFSLAREYSGIALGPAPFPLDDATTHYDLLTIVREVLIEGCVGETLAALTAQRAAQTAAPPDLRRCLEDIARDEMNHSLLAWRFVQWARSRDRSGVDALLADLLRELEHGRNRASTPQGPSFPKHGQLGAAEKLRIRRRAERDVVIPLLRSMLVERADHLASTRRIA